MYYYLILDLIDYSWCPFRTIQMYGRLVLEYQLIFGYQNQNLAKTVATEGIS